MVVLVKYDVVFPVLRAIKEGGRKGYFWTQVMDGVVLATTLEGASVGREYFRSGENLAWMFCRLGSSLKDHVVISWPHTRGSVIMATWRL